MIYSTPLERKVIFKSQLKVNRGEKMPNTANTAIKRNRLSVPMRTALDKGLITFETTVHDYGCGKGDDIKFLKDCGIQAAGHDLDYGVKTKADVVTLFYVINTIQNPITRICILLDAYLLADKYLIVAARTDEKSLKHATKIGDHAYKTKRGTFQKFYTNSSLIEYVSTVCENKAVKLTNGVVYINKESE
jgi:DNA phosphorothioation-associated putative methyltransferase